MTGRTRVLIEGLEDISNPSYRPGDKLRTLKHQVAGDDEIIKDVVVEVGYDDHVQATNPFGIDSDGKVKLNSAFFVKTPPKGKPLTFKVIKEHRIQKDALIGTAELKGTTEGKRRLQLMRHEKPRGWIIVEVSDGISASASTPAGKASTPARQAAGGAAMLPAAALRSGTTPDTASHKDGAATSSSAEAGGGVGAAIAGCMDCVTGIMDLLGLRDNDAAFMEAKAKDPNVVKCKSGSGLMYKVLKRGKVGQPPGPYEQVKCSYTGRLTNGKIFDTTEQGGDPVTFRRVDVIKGWEEALGLMHEGDRWELYVPGHLGYGEQGQPSAGIKPNAVLVFEMEIKWICGRDRKK